MEQSPLLSQILLYHHHDQIPARKAMNEALDKGIRPDAVICANDFMAINVISVLKERGFNVPEDVLVHLAADGDWKACVEYWGQTDLFQCLRQD